MAKILVEELGDALYRLPLDSEDRPLPSPNELRGRFVLREKPFVDEDDLVALPTVHLSDDVQGDIRRRESSRSKLSLSDPVWGSPSFAEGKVDDLFKNEPAIFAYTARHFAKSYPKALRQAGELP